VTALEVFDVYGGGLKEILHQANMSEGDIAAETGIPRSTVSSIVNDRQRTLTDQSFRDKRQAIANVLKKRMESKAPRNAGSEPQPAGLRSA
jgi:transcriptional regulator with XRE-family HTH domain